MRKNRKKSERTCVPVIPWLQCCINKLVIYEHVYTRLFFSIHWEKQTQWLVHSKSFTDLSRSSLVLCWACCWYPGHVVSAAQNAWRSGCSHPGCKWSEWVIYAQPLDSFLLSLSSPGSFISKNLSLVLQFRQASPEALKAFHGDFGFSSVFVGC